MIWGLGTGGCGTLSLARELEDGVHEPRPGLSPSCDVLEVLRGRLEVGRPCVDRLHSLLIPQIRDVDPNSEIIFLIRNPWDCVRSMVATGHCDVSSPPHFPIPRERNPVIRAAIMWTKVNAQIYKDGFDRIMQTEDLAVHEGRGSMLKEWSFDDEETVSRICAWAWWPIWDEHFGPQTVGEEERA